MESEKNGAAAFFGSEEDGTAQSEGPLPDVHAERKLDPGTVARESLPTSITLASLRRKKLPPPELIVDNLLMAGDIIVIAGRPKSSKSCLTAQLARDVSRGQAFLGLSVSKKRRVLIVDLENGLRMAKDRFTRMAPADPADRNVVVVSQQGLAEGGISLAAEGFPRLKELVRTHRPEVLILDPWRYLVGGDERNLRVVTEALKNIAQLKALVPGLAVIIVHHVVKKVGTAQALRKDPDVWLESAAGSYALVAHANATFGIAKEVRSDGRQVFAFAGVARAFTPRPFLLEQDQRTLELRPLDDPGFTDVERKLWAIIGALQQAFAFTEGWKAVAPCSNKKAYASMLKKATRAGLIIRVAGRYTVCARPPGPVVRAARPRKRPSAETGTHSEAESGTTGTIQTEQQVAPEPGAGIPTNGELDPTRDELPSPDLPRVEGKKVADPNGKTVPPQDVESMR